MEKQILKLSFKYTKLNQKLIYKDLQPFTSIK